MTKTVARSIVWFDEGETRNELLGGKVRSLAEMTAAGFEVPPGFAVTTEAFRAFVARGDLLDRIRSRRHALDPDDLASVEAASRKIAELIEGTPLPAELADDLRAAYAALEERAGVPNVPVAVRSSGVSEDLEGASFAGQYQTYLRVRGEDDVLTHVRRCWTGLFGPAVLTYRPRSGLHTADELPPGMCVGVQQMVDARSAGVMFTLDPVNGDRSKIVIEACWGLGEGVVSGDVTPDRFRVDKVTLEVLETAVSMQSEEHRFDDSTGGVALLPVEAERGERACLSDEEVVRIGELGKRLERHKGAPQDLEWAIDHDGRLHLLQARPETVWSTKPARRVSTGSGGAVDRVLAKFMNPGGRSG
jgi:pyruvate, water dikinase